MNIILKDEDYEKKKGKIRLYEHEATENTEKKYVISKYDTPL